jgi:hypothetical protein
MVWRGVPAPQTAVMPREGGASSTPRLHGSIAGVSGILDHPLSRVMTARFQTAVRDLAACFRARFARNVLPSQSEGAGNAGRSTRPQPGGQKRVEVLTSSSHHGHTGITRHSPRNGFTVSFVLSPVIRIWLTPSSADNSTDLTPTLRRQDHTTSPSASSASSKAPSASTASRPASVTLRNAPLSGAG